MSQLKDFITDFDMSAPAQSSPTIDAFGAAITVPDSGSVHVQIVSDFVNSATIVIPTISADGINYAPINKGGVRIEVPISELVTAFIIKDMKPGTSMRLGLIYGGQATGNLSIKYAA